MNSIASLTAILLVTLSCNAQDTWKKTSAEFIFTNPPFNGCHASTLVSLSHNKILAAWFGGSHEGAKDVCIWISQRENGKWTAPVLVATGIINDTLRYPTWNPVLFKDRSGILHLYYKVGPSPREWWGMEMNSNDDGLTWSRPVRLAEGILGPIKNKPIQLKDGTILSGSSIETTQKWMVHMERSEDNGITWNNIPVDHAALFNVIQPTIVTHKDGRLQILCRSKEGAVVQAWSSDNGKTWSKLTKTSLLNPNSGVDAVTLQNGQQLIVYNPDLPGKEWFNGRANLNVAISDDGIQWKDIAILENGKEEEFSYPAVIQTSDGKVHITYTFDRKNIKYVVLENSKR